MQGEPPTGEENGPRASGDHVGFNRLGGHQRTGNIDAKLAYEVLSTQLRRKSGSQGCGVIHQDLDVTEGAGEVCNRLA